MCSECHKSSKNTCYVCSECLENLRSPRTSILDLLGPEPSVEPVEIKVAKCSFNAKLPEKKTKGSACFDLSFPSGGYVRPCELVVFGTGLKFDIPEGYYMEVTLRSSIGKKGFVLANSVGIIDSDYRGEVKALLYNLMPYGQWIKDNERVLQARIRAEVPTYFAQIHEDDLSFSERGEGGIGSTGET